MVLKKQKGYESSQVPGIKQLFSNEPSVEIVFDAEFVF